MSRQHVVFVVKQPLEQIPPCVSHVLALRAADIDVTLICSPSAAGVSAQLAAHGVSLVALQEPGRATTDYGGLAGWTRFRRAAPDAIRRARKPDSVLWIGTADTALALGDVLLRQRGYVLTLLELYDTLPHYRAALGPLARRAGAIVVAERTRGQIMRNWWSLAAEPITIPNKPFDAPRQLRMQPTTAESAAALELIDGQKILLYQGMISPERNLVGIARAVTSCPDLRFAVMGNDYEGHLAEIRRANPDVLRLPHVPAPAHLEVTSHATIGVATYTPTNLNTLFCAPNKIFEYAAFSIPILANDVPGLRLTVESCSAGLCIDTTRPAAVTAALDELTQDYQRYSDGSRRLFETTNTSGLAAAAVDLAASSRPAPSTRPTQLSG